MTRRAAAWFFAVAGAVVLAVVLAVAVTILISAVWRLSTPSTYPAPAPTVERSMRCTDLNWKDECTGWEVVEPDGSVWHWACAANRTDECLKYEVSPPGD